MRYGYARVSTEKQNLGRQIETLEGLGIKIIYKEKITGTNIDRPEFKKLLKTVKSGDVIYFDSVSRMSRDAEEGKRIYFELIEKGVELIFIKEPDINSALILETMNKALEISLGDNNSELIAATEDYIKKILLIQAREQVAIRFNQAQKEVDDIRQRVKEGMAVAKANGKQIGRKKGSKVVTDKEKEMIEKIKKLDKSFNGTLKAVEVIELLDINRKTYFKYKKKIKDSLEVV